MLRWHRAKGKALQQKLFIDSMSASVEKQKELDNIN